MAISGPPRSSFGLFGGPGFIVALLAVLAGGTYLAIQMTGGRMPGNGASLSLAGQAPQPVAPMPGAPRTDQEPASVSEAASAALQSMPPLAQGAGAAPGAEPAPLPAIDLEWSPADLLDEFPPDPAMALPDMTSATDTEALRRASTAPAAAHRLALVAVGMGADRAATARAIVGTPADVSLSFAPGSADLADWINAARAYGHEALVDLHLGRTDGADTDRALLPELRPEENLLRLEAILAAAPGIAGVTVLAADSFLGDAAALTPILERLQARGLVIIGLPITAPLTVSADRVLDGPMTARDMLELKTLVRRRGAALVLATPENALLMAQSWTQPGAGIGGELPLVPASALVED